ncbi:hypothetical protein [Paraburkholderia hospita]|uniref:hypothetical protein n=1 Tax=Paraburkholderia hospita TaxID=169430 RepID=UPI000B3475E4|nr:hypothetical protein [Paraburkholderia hospita]OUL97833.1 hypothetical protein CA603_00470 [Paraburkholderia hospita]
MNRRLNLDEHLQGTLKHNGSRRAFAARLDMTIKRAKVTSGRVARSLGVPEHEVTLWRAGVTVPKSADCAAFLNFSMWTLPGYARFRRKPQRVAVATCTLYLFVSGADGAPWPVSTPQQPQTRRVYVRWCGKCFVARLNAPITRPWLPFCSSTTIRNSFDRFDYSSKLKATGC